MMQSFVKLWWGTLCRPIGTRNVCKAGRKLKSSMRDTTFYYSEDQYPAVAGHVALTIDDGLCRNGAENCLAEEVMALLEEYEAKATFFLCSDYVVGPCEDSAKKMLAAGHEFGNHMPKDGEYMSLDEDAFEAEFLKTAAVLDALIGEPGKVRWFRTLWATPTAMIG